MLFLTKAANAAIYFPLSKGLYPNRICKSRPSSQYFATRGFKYMNLCSVTSALCHNMEIIGSDFVRKMSHYHGSCRLQ